MIKHLSELTTEEGVRYLFWERTVGYVRDTERAIWKIFAHYQRNICRSREFYPKAPKKVHRYIAIYVTLWNSVGGQGTILASGLRSNLIGFPSLGLLWPDLNGDRVLYCRREWTVTRRREAVRRERWRSPQCSSLQPPRPPPPPASTQTPSLLRWRKPRWISCNQ